MKVTALQIVFADVLYKFTFYFLNYLLSSRSIGPRSDVNVIVYIALCDLTINSFLSCLILVFGAGL